MIAIAFGTLGLASIVIWKNLDLVVRQTFLEPGELSTTTEADEAWQHRSLLVVPCVFIASIALAFAANLPPFWARVTVFAGLVLLFALAQLSGGFMRCYVHVHAGRRETGVDGDRQGMGSTTAALLAILHVIWMVALSAAVSSGLVIAVWQATGGWPPWDRVAFAPPLVCLSLVVGASLHLGLMGSDYADGAREWIARAGSMLALTCAGWAALFVMAIHAPRWAAWLLGEHGATGLTLISGWVATTVAGVLVGRSAAHQRRRRRRPRRSGLGWLTAAAPTVFIFGYVLFLSYAAHAALVMVSPPPTPAGAAATTPANRLTVDVRVPETSPAIEIDVRGPQTRGWLETTLEPVARFGEGYYNVLRLTDAPGQDRYARPLWVLAFLGGCVAITWIASLRFNINEFSMHHFYKNRLVRCYLGASTELEAEAESADRFRSGRRLSDLARCSRMPASAYHGPVRRS